MNIFRNISKKLLLAVFTLATVSSFSLNAMKRMREESVKVERVRDQNNQNAHQVDLFFEHLLKYHIVKAAAEKIVGPETIFPSELIRYISRIHLEKIISPFVDEIAQTAQKINNASYSGLIKAIENVCQKFEMDLSIEIVIKGLNKSGISFYTELSEVNDTIENFFKKNKANIPIEWLPYKSTVRTFMIKSPILLPELLMEAASGGSDVTVDLCLYAALKFCGKDKTWTWICRRDDLERRAFDCATLFSFNEKVVTIFIRFIKDTFGSEKLWEFLLAKKERRFSFSAWETCNERITAILEELQIEIPEEYK